MGALPQVPVGQLHLAQIAGQIALVAIVAAALYGFQRTYRRSYLRHWLLSWSALALYLVAAAGTALAHGLGPANHPLRLGIATVCLVAGYLHIVWLLLGTWELASGREAARRHRQVALGLAVLGGVLSALASAAAPGGSRFFLRLGLRSLFAGTAYLGAAAWILRTETRRPRRMGRTFMAVALLIYGSDQIAYFLFSVPAGPGGLLRLVHVGIADIVALAMLGLALVTWLLEEEREAAVRADQETARRQRAQACVYRISDAAHSVRDLPELFRSIHASIAAVLPARNFYIALFDRARDRLSFPYFVDEHDPTPSEKPLGRGLTEYVLRTGQPLLATPEVFRDLIAHGDVELIATDSVDWLGVPLLAGGEATGVIVIQTYDPAVRLGPDERDLLVYVSEQVASVIAAKRTEEALRQSEARLRVTLEQAPAILWTTDEQLRFTSSVGSGLAALGLVPGQVVGMTIAEYLGPGSAGVAAHERALGGESVSYDYEFGGRFYATHLEPLRDAGGTVRGTIGLAVDVSEERRARKEVEGQARRFRSLIENAQDNVSVVDTQGIIRYEGPAVERMLGYRPDEIVGRHAAEFFHPDDAALMARAMAELFEGRATKLTHEVRMRHRDGSWRLLEGVASRFVGEDGQPLLIVNSRNVSERRQAEQAQRASEARLRQVIDLVPHFIFAKDEEGRFLLVNKAVADAYGTTVESLLGRRDADFNPSEAEVRHFLEDDLEVMRSGRPKLVPEERITDSQGRLRYLETTKIPFTFSGTDRPAVLGVSLDITARKAAEEALRRAAKEESLAVLAGGVAHDFNNLLAALLGHVSLAASKLVPGSPARAHLEKAAAAAERAADLTRQMLAYSGRGRFVVEPTDLARVVRDNLPLLQVALPKNVRLKAQLDRTTPLIDADVGQVQQVLMNLVINAAEAIGAGGGTVTVRLARHAVRADDAAFWRFTVQALAPGEYVLLEVSDDGPGIPAEKLERVFDPFYTTKFAGRGLGLAAVLGIVRGHGGGLAVESEPGRGTSFRLLFAPSQQTAVTRGEAPHRGKGGRLSVLVIDDEDAVREMVAEVLESEGLNVTTADDGASGVRAFRDKPAQVDVVLLDLSMPGLSGEETFRRLRAIKADVRVILSSGYDHHEATRRFEGQRPDGFIQKPYRPEELLAEIRRCMESRPR